MNGNYLIESPCHEHGIVLSSMSKMNCPVEEAPVPILLPLDSILASNSFALLLI